MFVSSHFVYLSFLVLIQTQEVLYPIPVTVAEPGHIVTLTCQIPEGEIMLLYWYRLNFVYMVQIAAAGTFDRISPKGQFDNSEFTVTKVGAHYFLNIRNFSKEDEDTYFCQAGSAYTMKIINGTILVVNGKVS